MQVMRFFLAGVLLFTLALFFRSAWGLGEGPAAPPQTTQPAQSAAPAPGEGVFDPAPILRIAIQIPEEALDELRGQTRGPVRDRPYVKAAIREGGKEYRDVGLRLKGSIGSFRPVDQKPGLSLKFDQFVSTQRFHGLRKLILDNSVQDPSYLSQLIGNELFRGAGVPAPRIGFAVVELNGRRLGFYLLTEAVTEDFLARWFKDPGGNLYEGPGDVGSQTLDVDSHGGVSDRADLKKLVEATRVRDSAQRMERLKEVLDVERFISFAAMEAVTNHWDGYVIGRNNYRIYQDVAAGRMVFLPHGTDQLFQNPGAPLHPNANGLVAKAVLKTAAGRKLYRERVRSLLDTLLDPEALGKRLRSLEARMRPVIGEEGAGALFSHALSVRSLVYRIAERRKSVEAQLSGDLVVPAGQLLGFDGRGRARLRGWQPQAWEANPSFEQEPNGGEKGGMALKLSMEPGSGGRASYRKRVFLPAGRYLFTGRVRLEGVKPLERTLPDGGPSGVDLRLSQEQPGSKLLGTRGWTTSEFEFEIEAEEGLSDEASASDALLVCELQAASGTAWFDEASLELRKLPRTAPGGALKPAPAPPSAQGAAQKPAPASAPPHQE